MARGTAAKTISTILGFALLAGLGFGVFLLVRATWRAFDSLESDIAVGLITGGTTILVATGTIVLGKYFERKRATEAHFRERQVIAYDEFLSALFEVFHSGEGENLVAFLRDWQRKMIVWGGGPVLKSYIAWMQKLRSGEPDAQTVFMMEDFFRAMRKDLGLSNRGLGKGSFANIILRNPELFLAMAEENPNVTLADLAEREKELGLTSDG